MSQRHSGSKHHHSQRSATVHGVSQADVMERYLGTGRSLGSHIGGKKGRVP